MDNPRRRRGLPGKLLSRMVRKYGRDGMAEAWKAYDRGIRRNDPEDNPSEEVMIARNPKRKRHSPRGKRGEAVALSSISLTQPMTLLKPVAFAMGGFIATSKIPAMVGITSVGITQMGVRAGVGIGGGFLISKYLGKTNGALWMIGASINLLVEILNTYVFKTSPLAMGAFPASHYQRGYTAPPQEFSEFGDIGAYPQEFAGAEGYPM